MDKQKITKLSGIISIVILLGALLPDLPYAYFQFLRWIVTLTAIFYAYSAYNTSKTAVVVVSILIAILFNPIAPIYLERETWVVIDVITAGILFFIMTKIKSGK